MIIDVGWYRDEVNTDIRPYVDLANGQQHVVSVKRRNRGRTVILQVCYLLSCGMLAWLCLGQGADLHMAQLMPLLLTVSCSSKSRLVYLPGFTFLVPAHPGSPGQNPRRP